MRCLPVMKPEHVRARRLLFDDFEVYARHALKVRTKDGHIAPLRLNAAQRLLHEAAEAQRRRTGRVRAIVLKARQQGLSTYIGARLYWLTSQRRARKTMVIAHLADSTKALFDLTRRYHANVPAPLRPEIRHSSRRELSFSALDSAYMVATAGSDGAGRGETLNYVHASELAFWPPHRARDTFNGLMQAVPDAGDTEVYVESTANGVTGLFHQLWQDAVEGRSGFVPVFIPWFVSADYREEPAADFRPTDEEAALADRHGLDLGQLAWRRRKVAQNGLDLFRQEYPAEPDEAFLTTGRPVFNPESLQLRLRSVPDLLHRLALEGCVWQPHRRGELAVYRLHDPGERYYIGADVGMGLRNGDWSVAQVLDSRKRQVAVWRERVHPDHFAEVLYHLGLHYNTARIIVERNNHGILTCTRLAKDLAYPDFYTEQALDTLAERVSPHLGFLTTTRSKPLIIDQLRAALRDGAIELNDKTTIRELMTYVVNRAGAMTAEAGCHDDAVMALALANHIHEAAFDPIPPIEDFYTEAI